MGIPRHGSTSGGFARAGAIRRVLVAFGMLVGVFAFGSVLFSYSGSVTSPGTVVRISDWNTASVRVDEPGGSRLREVRIDSHNPREYTAGTRIEVRYWPDSEQIAVDTAHEPPWVVLVTFAAIGLVCAGFAGFRRLAARRSWPTSR